MHAISLLRQPLQLHCHLVHRLLGLRHLHVLLPQLVHQLQPLVLFHPCLVLHGEQFLFEALDLRLFLLQQFPSLLARRVQQRKFILQLQHPRALHPQVLLERVHLLERGEFQRFLLHDPPLQLGDRLADLRRLPPSILARALLLHHLHHLVQIRLHAVLQDFERLLAYRRLQHRKPQRELLRHRDLCVPQDSRCSPHRTDIQLRHERPGAEVVSMVRVVFSPVCSVSPQLSRRYVLVHYPSYIDQRGARGVPEESVGFSERLLKDRTVFLQVLFQLCNVPVRHLLFAGICRQPLV
mmetsp:Transcript_18408/g.41934  ORF Transcript_18408/g.41934 Transcript_18408/m.41934 type:complete len:295 (-) Transcript_18408:418-1302(-)